MENIARYTLLAGVVLIVVGALLYGAAKLNLPLGRLPGDIRIEGPNGSFYFPLVTCIILSVVLTVVLNLIGRFLEQVTVEGKANKPRIEALTFLRFVAAFIVVLYHFGQETDLARFAQPAIIAGLPMVTFFFVLSGFVLLLAYYPEDKSPKTFYLARMARILPMYLVALGLFCCLYYARTGIQDYTPLVLHLTFLQAWISPYPASLNVPAWSLSVEAFFYLSFPLLLAAVKSTRVKFPALLAVAVLSWLITQVVLVYIVNSASYSETRSLLHDLVTYFPLSHYCSFLLGVAGGYAFLQTRERSEQPGKRAFVLLLFSFALVYFLLQYPSQYVARFGFSLPLGSSFYAPAFLFLILCVAYCGKALAKIFTWPVLVILGEASYSVYILQAPVHLAYVRYLSRRLALDANFDFYLYLSILLCISVLTLYLVEKPARRFLLNATRRRSNDLPANIPTPSSTVYGPRSSMKTSDFDYLLPPASIAQTPAEPRDASRLLVLQRASGAREHRAFREVGHYLRPGDLLVLNRTRVIPARIFARKATGGRVELLLLRREDARTWEALVGGKGLTDGKTLTVEDGPRAEIVATLAGSRRLVRFETPIEPFFPKVGHVPLPPYIHTELKDPERYQTVYAREPGSAAAPTAGLHFTPRLLDELQAAGVRLAYVTLHVGLDTFAPVTEADPGEHVIHTEWCELSQDAADAINETRAAGGRIIAVGTTSVRTLESAARATMDDRPRTAAGSSAHHPSSVVRRPSSVVDPFTGDTALYILPGYKFQLVDAIITNFHLPKSTLLMLVSAFVGREMILDTYNEAIRAGYRFFSFGDAMLIL